MTLRDKVRELLERPDYTLAEETWAIIDHIDALEKRIEQLEKSGGKS